MKRSALLDLSQYDTDKNISGYMDRYDALFEGLVEKDVTLLELGINRGGSLSLWRDYFPNGSISGVDLNPPEAYVVPDRVRMFRGNQVDTGLLTQIAQLVAPAGFDLIIDDASHLGVATKISFWHLFEKHLKPGGLYIIEDWGTGYWDHWMDGKAFIAPGDDVPAVLDGLKHKKKVPFASHGYGMVGFIKQLIDEVAAGDVSYDPSGATTPKVPRLEYVNVSRGLVVIKKCGVLFP